TCPNPSPPSGRAPIPLPLQDVPQSLSPFRTCPNPSPPSGRAPIPLPLQDVPQSLSPFLLSPIPPHPAPPGVTFENSQKCLPTLPHPEHGQRDEVVSGQPEAEGRGLRLTLPSLPSSHPLSPHPPPPPLSYSPPPLLLSYPPPPLSPSLPLPPSPSQNMVNVTRWFLEDLQLKEEDSVVVKMDIEGWLLEDLQLKEEDSVVVKMDIEGYEWEILQHWISNPRMAAIVDELFVEVHYHHPSMTEFMWTEEYFIHTREDATRLLTDLRKAGFYVHPWP
ncbi:unnamed protein product, partial [Closterium sp. NIES-65]